MKAPLRYVALLRGINVGGNNVIKMVDLKASFESMGFTDVVTLIQSGNVVFSAVETSKPKLHTKIERALSERFTYASTVVILSSKDLALVVEEAPPKFGTQATRYRYDVLFVKPPLTPKKALADIPTKPGVDECHAGTHAIYFRRAIAKVTQSHLSKVVAHPVYKSLTIRNWNTTSKLHALTQV